MTLQEYINSPIKIRGELLRFFNQNEELVVLDVGASEGEDTVKYSQFFPNARVIAIEPLPSNLEKLKNNVERFGKGNIEIVPAAASNFEGQADFFVSSGRGVDLVDEEDMEYTRKPVSRSSSLLPPHKHLEVHPQIKFETKVVVQVQTLKSILNELQIDEVHFTHMDVQGAELLALQGAGKSLRRFGMIWMEVEAVELYKDQPLKAEVEKFMKKNNFIKIKDTVNKVSGDQLYIRRGFAISKLGISKYIKYLVTGKMR